MYKYELTIVTPAAAERKDRLNAMFERLVLNQKNHPEIPFEWIVVDSSPQRPYLDIVTQRYSRLLNVKYVSLPIDRPYPNPAYMRNCGFRLSEARVVCLADIDWFLSEHFVKGATNFPAGQQILNVGYVIDSSKGCPGGVANKNLIDFHNACFEIARSVSIDDVYDYGHIPAPQVPNAVWMWSTERDLFFKIRGYDEKFCLGGYGAEDDDLYFRLEKIVSTDKSNYSKFCAVHFWHPQPARSDNSVNKTYLASVSKPVQHVIRNHEHDWGKIMRYGYAHINGKMLKFNMLEDWIKENVGIDTYTNQWDNFDNMLADFNKTK